MGNLRGAAYVVLFITTVTVGTWAAPPDSEGSPISVSDAGVCQPDPDVVAVDQLLPTAECESGYGSSAPVSCAVGSDSSCVGRRLICQKGTRPNAGTCFSDQDKASDKKGKYGFCCLDYPMDKWNRR